jgi:bla regulator protein blaR1
MWVWVDRFSATILDASFAAAVLLGVAALAMVGCRQPSRRRSLARAAIVASLTLIPLVAYGPTRPRIEVVSPIRTVLAPVVSGFSDQIFRKEWGALEPPISSGGQLVPAGRWVSRTLTLAYLIGAFCSLGWLVLGWWCSSWVIRRAAEPGEATRDEYAALPYVKTRHRPRLRVATRLRRPVLLGIIRPVILIPPELDRTEARDQLRLSLLHELAHAEVYDPWLWLAGNLALVAWFFVPWAWWVRRQMRLDQEFLADHNAAVGFGPFGTYASSLVELAAPGPTEPVAEPVRQLPLWGASSALFQRILMLVRCPYPVETRTPRWWRLGLLPVVAGGTLLASGLTLRSAEPNVSVVNSPPVASTSARSFRLSRLVIAESPAGTDGWTAPYNLPLAAPERFELRLELWAGEDDLAWTRIADCPLGLSGTDATVPPEPPRWHKVQIRREPNHAAVQVDDREVPANEVDDVVSIWLSIQPAPNRLGLIRNIVVTW